MNLSLSCGGLFGGQSASVELADQVVLQIFELINQITPGVILNDLINDVCKFTIVIDEVVVEISISLHRSFESSLGSTQIISSETTCIIVTLVVENLLSIFNSFFESRELVSVCGNVGVNSFCLLDGFLEVCLRRSKFCLTVECNLKVISSNPVGGSVHGLQTEGEHVGTVVDISNAEVFGLSVASSKSCSGFVLTGLDEEEYTFCGVLTDTAFSAVVGPLIGRDGVCFEYILTCGQAIDGLL